MRFCDIPGHEEVKRRLRQMVDADRLPHALLLEGPAGIGKLAMARALAQYNNCERRTPGGDACGECPVCRQMETFNQIDTLYSYPVVKTDSGRTPVSDDFFAEWKQFLTDDPYNDFERWSAMSGKANGRPVIYVSESNDLIHKLSFQSHGVRYKTVILWLPERMNEETANKLLKMIEEPYPNTFIIMVSNEPGLILPTIYSRLQRVTMKRLPDAVVAQELVRHDGIGPEDALAIAHMAEGSMIAARNALKVTRESQQHLDMFKELMRMAWTRNVAKLKDWAFALAALGRERELKFYEYCQRLIRENFMLNFNTPDLNFLNPEEAAFSRNFARFVTEANVERIIGVLDKAREDIAGNANGKIVNFDVAIKMILLLKQ